MLLSTPMKSASSGPPDGPPRRAPPTTAIAFAPDGKQLLLASQAGIELRTWPELEPAGQWPTELVHVHDLAFAPDGKRLLAAGGSPAEAGFVEIRAWPDAHLVGQVTSHADLVTRARWSPDGANWATAGADALCQVFASDTMKVAAGYKGHSRSALALCFLPDGNAIVSAGVDQTLQVWDRSAGTHQRTFSNHAGCVNDLALKPWHEAPSALPMLASASDDRTVRLWQPTIGRMVRFVKLPSVAHTLCWSLTGERLLVGCDDGCIRVLDGESLEVIRSIELLDSPVIAMALDPSGRMVIAARAGQPIAIPY